MRGLGVSLRFRFGPGWREPSPLGGLGRSAFIPDASRCCGFISGVCCSADKSASRHTLAFFNFASRI